MRVRRRTLPTHPLDPIQWSHTDQSALMDQALKNLTSPLVLTLLLNTDMNKAGQQICAPTMPLPTAITAGMAGPKKYGGRSGLR